MPVEIVKQHQQRVEVPGGKTLPLGARPRAVPVEGQPQAQPQPQASPQTQPQPQPDGVLERPRPTDSPAVEPTAGGIPGTIPETIMLNILSMLSTARVESPADDAEEW